MKSSSTRRDFVFLGGAAIGAGVASAAAGPAAAGGKNVDAAADLHENVDLAAGLRKRAGAAAGSRNGVNVAAEREAIRQLHLTLLAHVEKRDFAGAADLFAAASAWRASGLGDAAAAQSAREQGSAQSAHERGSAQSRLERMSEQSTSRRSLAHTAYRQTSAQRLDDIALTEDGAHATARFHVEAEVCTPIQGDCTAAQMARLQGNVASRHWESGRFDAKLAKTQGNWKIVSLVYERVPSIES